MRVLWFFLCSIEPLYKFAFFIHQKIRRSKSPYRSSRFAIIAVGNISVGGTGKTVVTRFLLTVLGAKTCAVLLRGYGAAKTGGPSLVHDGTRQLVTVTQAGDEAVLLAQSQHVCTAISPDRKAGCMLLEQVAPPAVTIVLLDDAYQNHSLEKQCELLLLDARAPFGNNHCLPAGPLREKDITRAHAIICTHADALKQEQRHMLAQQVSAQTKAPIFWGKHSPAGLWIHNATPIDQEILGTTRSIAVAGIGSFSGFIDSATEQGAYLVGSLEFPDHHAYTRQDMDLIVANCNQHAATMVIVTEKDWVKLEHLVVAEGLLPDITVAVLRVQFEFLTTDQYSGFTQLVRRELKS